MTFAVAAAGTGGHVYPALAVAEALVDRGIEPEAVLFVGGSRLESTAVPAAGFPFVGVELRGLRRSVSLSNLGIPRVLWRAVKRMTEEFRRRGVRVVLGMGGYVTPPAVLAGRRVGARVVLAEQNAEAGLANRTMAPLATRIFGAFPVTRGLERAEWVGNPVRRALARFDRGTLRAEAAARYGLDPDRVTVGVFGGSLGAGVLNRAVARMVDRWSGPPIQLVHLVGEAHLDSMKGSEQPWWKVLGYEDRMDLFYAASDLVVSRAGGSVAELLVTRTPAVLVPGRFGSGAHQRANAEALAREGAALMVTEDELDRLGEAVAALASDPDRRERMAEAAGQLARPDAAEVIAKALEELHGPRPA